LFPEVEIGEQFLYEREHLLLGLSFALAKSARGNRTLNDRDLIAALTSLTKSYETMVNSSLIYEQRTTNIEHQAIASEIEQMVKEFREAEQKHIGLTRLRDSDVLKALVFLLRMSLSRTSEAGLSFPDQPPISSRRTSWPAGRAASSSRAVFRNCGCKASGAISASGSSTNRR